MLVLSESRCIHELLCARAQAEYDLVPTTVFTPLEYGAIGLSEEEAVAKYGEENLEVYHVKFNPLEWRLRQDDADDVCYAKLICLKTEVQPPPPPHPLVCR